MPAAAQHARRLGDRAVGLVREMQRLMDDDAVDARIVHRQVQEIALDEVDRDRLAGELGASDAQHVGAAVERGDAARGRRETTSSEEHTTDLQSIMRISYAVFCLEKKK